MTIISALVVLFGCLWVYSTIRTIFALGTLHEIDNEDMQP